MDGITKTKPPKEEEEEDEEEVEEEDEEEVEEEDAPSLSDFPLNSDEPEKNYSSHKVQDKRRSFSEPSDLFEFFNDFTSEMSHAEDIICRGKLVPCVNQHQILKSLSADEATRFSRRNNLRSSMIRSNSLTSTRPPRNRRFLEGKTSRRRRRCDLIKSDAENIRRSFSKSSARWKGSSKVASKPGWFVLMFGPLRLQPEMDLQDMRIRQVRRSPGSMFPIVDAGGGTQAGRRSFWGFDLVRVLSCTSHASVAVTASVGLARRC